MLVASLRAGSPVVLDVDPHQPSLAVAAVAARVAIAIQSPLRLVRVIISGIRSYAPIGWQICDATRRLASVAALAAASPLDVGFEERDQNDRARSASARRGSVVPPPS